MTKLNIGIGGIDMSYKHCINEDRRGKHITEVERYKVEALVKEGFRVGEIARHLGRSKRTLQRELRRGQIQLLNSDLTYRVEYAADVAQRDYEEKAQNKGPTLKIGYAHDLVEHIEKKIGKEDYSPDAVIGEIREKGLKFKASICTKTLYNYIDRGLFLHISNKELPMKGRRKKRRHRRVRVAHNNIKGTSIEERPKSVDKREAYGHWEMDCIVGKRGGKGPVLLVLTERVTREEIIRKIPSKTQKSVCEALDKMERKLRGEFYTKFKSITVDNGSEFLDFRALEQSSCGQDFQRTKIYYAHPYSSWERGSNENANKLIRRFLPKGTDIAKVSNAQIQRIEYWMNNYPRRLFRYKTAFDMVRLVS